MMMASVKLLYLQILLIPNFILWFSLFSRSYGKPIHSDTGRMRQAIANLTEDQNDAPESSASGVPQQVVSGPSGRGAFPANFSLYFLSDIYPLQNISELQIDLPYIEMNWGVFSRSDSSIYPGSQEDSIDAPETIPTHAKDSLKLSENQSSTMKNSSIFLESSSVTKGSEFSANHSLGNKVTDIPSKTSLEMAKDSLHIVNETHIYHINKIQPERTSEDADTVNSQGDVDWTAITYRSGPAVPVMYSMPLMMCRNVCHVLSSDSDLDCVVDFECCGIHYSGEDHLNCLFGNLTMII